jgi:stearoyl-CoA desaturase (delta-9 desaturase)
MTQLQAGASAPRIWTTTILFSLTFLGAITLVPWYGITVGFSTAAWGWFAAFLMLTGLSITAGYHRLWSHRCYDAHWSVRLLFMIFGSMALQNSILIWSSGHRVHHRYVDDNDRDPYSAGRGFWFSHIGWMLREYPSGKVDFSNVRDLERDPIVMFQHRHYVPLVLATNIGLPLAVGWMSGDVIGTFLLAGLARLVINHHATFFINSLAHAWGTQPYTDANTARDNPVLAFLTYGEGYHNFHHIYAHDYRNGVRWWQWDPTKWLIRGLAGLGLASRLKRVPDVTIQRARLTMQFKRLEQKLERTHGAAPRLDLDRMRTQLRQEYETFMKLVEEWTAARDEWYAKTRKRLADRFSDSAFRRHTRAVVRQLRSQHRRLRQLDAQLA